MEQLVRIYLMLATTSPQQSDAREHALSAQRCVQHLLDTTLQNLSQTPALDAATDTPPSAATVTVTAGKVMAATPVATSTRGAKSAPALAAAPATTTVAATVPSIPSPSVPTDWATFQWPEALLQQLKSSADAERDTDNSLLQPETTLNWLDSLCDLLFTLGLHRHALPVLHCRRMLASAVVQSKVQTKAALVQLSSLLERLEMPDAALVARQQAGVEMTPDCLPTE